MNTTGDISTIINDIQQGKPVIIVDDEDREFEGDLTIAAQKANKYNLNFMQKHGRGLMCIPCMQSRLNELKIPMMVENQTDKYKTPFTFSVDSSSAETGVSIDDRLKVIDTFINYNSKPDELISPGHLFPLRARDGLLKERQGHTEASVELVKLAGLEPISVIIEIMNDDGSMTKGQQLTDFAKNYFLSIVSVKEIYNAVYDL
tara:strand:- start:825 stop:1433 length:609 start_codon:yes stop_codon:yes gene_type:complete